MESAVWAEVRRRVSPHGAAESQDPVRTVMAVARERLATFDGPLGLYPAIASLPSTQFDVTVLKYVLGYSTSRTAGLLGLHEATVRVQVRMAKRRLGADLGLFHPPLEDEP